MVFQKYTSFIKLEHSLFSLPLLFSGALIAGKKWPSFRITLLILLAGVSARIVALGLNRIIDRDIDRANPRTQDRHLAKGSMKLIEAWMLVVLSLAVYLLSAWLLSDFCLRWSWIPIVAFGAYPYFKRFTKFSHVGLGLVWSMVPLAGFFAIQPSFSNMGAVMMLAVFCSLWLAGFDIIYATLDEDFDRNASLHSLPASFGSQKALRISTVFHWLAYLTLMALYVVYFSGPITVMLLAIIGLFLYLEQKFSHYVDFAFFQINAAIAFVVFFFVYSGVKGF